MEKKGILCVDDEEDLLELLCDELEGEGFQVFTANNVEDALKIYQNNAVAVIFSDTRMPRGSGFDLVKSIRQQGGKEPFYLMTGLSDRSEEELQRMGVSGVIMKPFNFKKVVALAKQSLSD